MKKIYIRVLALGVMVSLSSILTACGGGGSSSTGTGGTTNNPSNTNPDAPTVKLISPNNGETGISMVPTIDIQFSTEVNNVNTKTVTLHEGSPTGNTVAIGAIAVESDNIYSFTPESTLNINSKYYVVIDPAIKSVKGNYAVTQTNFNFTTVKTYGYMVESQSTSLCSVDDTTQKLFDCVSTPSEVGGGYNVKLNLTASYIYISDLDNDRINVCKFNKQNGQLSNCSSSLNALFNSPSGITFDSTESHAYIATYGGVIRCTVDQVSGGLNNCDKAFTNGFLVSSIAFNESYSYAYITLPRLGGVDVCDFDESLGAISNCTQTGYDFNYPNTITLNSSSNTALITNPANSSVTLCKVDVGGVLDNCNSTGNGFSEPLDIVLTNNNYAYVTNFEDNSLSICNVDNTGGLQNCIIDSNEGFSTVYGVAIFNPTATN